MKPIALLLAAALTASAAPKPNIIVILIDDMGYGDIAAHGNPVIKTPNIDKLHAESARLTDFHVDPTCSPSRAALLTGKYSHHAKVWHTIAGGNHLRDSEVTMADVFRANGYRTGMFGKWHLGGNFPYRPMDRGFDEWLGQGDGGTGTTDDHFLNDRVNDHYIHNGEWEQIDGWAPEIFFSSTIGFARESKKAQKPFFAYLCTYLPHTPHTLPDPKWADAYKKKVDAKTAYFFAAIEKIDAMIGKLRADLAAEELDRDTILIFLTDNGGTNGVKTFNAGMRGQKGDVYDGGHRVPFFIHWPAGKLRQGEDIAALNAHIDVLPTLVELCGLKLPREVDFDGRSFSNQLLDASSEVPERTLFVERQRTFEPKKWSGAVGMTSRWRLVDDKELYDIKQDPGQKNNLISEHPEVVEKIRADFESYWKKVTPGDRDRAVFIVGDERDPETFLHAADWYLTNPPWNHALVAAAPNLAGDWRIRAASPGTYRFEVRRWPREADAPIAGVPKIKKTIDAWDASGPKPDLIYGNRKTKFKKLPVASVSLTVDGKTESLPLPEDAKEISFEFKLQADKAIDVKGAFLDKAGKVTAGTYYVYCRRIDPYPPFPRLRSGSRLLKRPQPQQQIPSILWLRISG
jgi:arylsulfatase A-like enzyme